MQHALLWVGLRLMWLTALLCLNTSDSALAESPAQRRFALMQRQSEQRAAYDRCVDATKDLDEHASKQAQRLCRRDYAMLRLIKAQDLWNTFDGKLLESQEEYFDRMVAVYGIVHKAGINSLGYPEVSFALDDFGIRSVRCQFPKSATEEVLSIQVGQKVTLAGICKGFANEHVVRINNAEIIAESPVLPPAPTVVAPQTEPAIKTAVKPKNTKSKDKKKNVKKKKKTSQNKKK